MTSTSDVLVIRKDSASHGVRYDQLCIRWWMWLLSLPRPVNPAFDQIGKFATANQDDPEAVFLCQTLESFKPIPRREIKIAYGKNIFMPIINWISFRDDEKQTDEYLKNLAKEKIDSVGKLELYINNKPLDKDLSTYRVQTSIFEMTLPNDNILDAKQGPTQLVSDGYWILFKPLVRNIELNSRGSCSSGITEIGINYNIVLE